MTRFTPWRPNAVPEWWQVRAEILVAADTLTAQYVDDWFHRRAEIAAIRRDLDRIVQNLFALRREWPSLLRSELLKYRPDQPRVPKGHPDGGEWTKEVSVASNNDPEIVSDATPDNTWTPGTRYAGGARRGGGARVGIPEDTPGQGARLTIAEARWRDAIARVRTLDPNWKPTPGLHESVEGEISNLEVQAQEAEEYLSFLSKVGIGPGPYAQESMPARGPERNFNDYEQTKTNESGARFGCHTCGRKDPGTISRNWVIDHQYPSALNPGGQSQRLYPQCIFCMWRQGGWVRYLNRREKP